jgi:uncharacterized protein involved in outer membrane biogenesis
MNRWLKRLLILIAILAVLMLASGLILQAVVSGSAKDRLTASLSEKLGATLTVSSADFDLGAWFLLKPAVTLEHVILQNPAGFPATPLVEAQRISAQLALFPLLRNNIDVKRIEIDNPRLRIETNAKGETNLEALTKHPAGGPASSPAPPASGSGSGSTLSIEELVITGGAVAVTGGATLNNRSIEIRLHDFSNDSASGGRCRLEISAKLFGGARSNFKLEGQAGPFTNGALPIEGTLNAVFALAEMPASLRAEAFGDLLGAPGDNATVTLNTSVKGDAYKELSAPAKLTLVNVMIGKDAKHTLALSGEVPIALAVSNLTATPQIQINIKDASLHLGKGEWSGSVAFQLRGAGASGSSQGGIHNVDIDELLSAVSTASGKVQGTAELAPYSLQFAGKSAKEINASLKGSAKLAVAQGKISALDMVASIEKVLGQAQGVMGQAPQAADATAGATPFTKLSAGLEVGGSKIDVNDLDLEGPTLSATGRGTIGFDHELNFDLAAKVTGNAASLVNKVAMGSQSNSATIPLTVTGTVDAPKVRPNIGKAVKQAVTEKAKGLLNSFIKPHP